MSIFTIEQREKVQERLLQVGIELIKEKGIKQMTVNEVTKRVGIGKGTFYHFYKAKEWYIYDVIQYSKEDLKRAFNDAVNGKGGLNRKAYETILHKYSFYGGNNILNYITPEDEAWLLMKLPKEYMLNVSQEDAIISSFLEKAKGIHGNPKPHVLANMMKIMALVAEQRELLHQDALQENMQLLEKQFLDYVFGSEE